MIFITEWKCREKLIVRDPYKRFGSCLAMAKKVAEEVIQDPYIVEDMFDVEWESSHKPHDWICDFSVRIPKECAEEGLTVGECIKKYGEFEYREWCFEEYPYKYGIEVDCLGGIIYAYYCQKD